MKENYFRETYKRAYFQDGRAYQCQFCRASDICKVEGSDSILQGFENRQKLTFRQ